MKPHLPISLLTAVLASFIAFPSQAVEVPSDYTPHYLADPDDLSDYRSTSGNLAFLLDGSITFTPSSATWWTSSQVLKGSGSTLFTIEEDGDPYSLTFKGGANKAFYLFALAIEDIGRVTFEGLKESNVDSSSAYYYYYYGGAIHATTLRLKGNSRVTFTGNEVISNAGSSNRNYYVYGGAIYGANGATITITETSGAVTFAQNKATSSSSSSDYSSSYGGAIYGESSSSISICDNEGDVSFTGNSSSAYDHSYGGAIYGANSSTISISGNAGAVNITGNSSSSSTYNSYGGAIYAGSSSTISICDNGGDVSFTGNSSSADDYSYGGAIYGSSFSTISICGNGGDVSFTGNSSSAYGYSYGGAIYGAHDSTISICGNTGDINITDNSAAASNASSYGGAIYSEGSLYLQNNGNTLIAGNYEKVGSNYRLRSIYMSSWASDGGHFHLSAAAGKSIEFNDSIYVASGTSGKTVDVIFNGSYTDADSNSIAQSGDIIFDGANVASTLASIKGSAATEAEISNSLTSYIGSTTHLEAGRLIIRNGAQFNGLGISTTARSGAAVVLQDAGMNHSDGSINLKRGTSLELSGQNAISAEDVTFSGGSTLKFTVDGANRENAVLNLDANLEHFSFTIAVNGEDMLLSGRYKLLELASADQYMDVDGYWNADDVNVSGTGDAAGAKFDNLVWENGTLYFEQGKTIWSNNSGNNLWNADSANWQRNGVNITCCNGMDILFTDSGAGTVQLVGEIAPHSITVENSEGNNYSFIASAEGGKLTGDTAIEKKGDGELALATANEHTGGIDLQGGTLRVQHSAALGAADATLTTAAGTLLSIENGADVTLSATGNELAGQVAVANGASLQVQSGGYAAESTVLNGSLSFTAGATGTAAGSLSGSGKLSVSGTATQVHFDTISGYSGGMAVSGNGASLSVGDGDYSGSGALSVTDGATLNLSNSAVELKQGGSLSVGGGSELQVESLLLGKGADLLAIMSENSFSLAELSVPAEVNTIMQTDKLIFDGCFADGQALNTVAAGSISATNGLTLQGGSTYTANGTNMNLNGGTLSFEDLSVRINLNLTTNVAELPSDYRIVLFSGVGGLNIDAEYFSTLNTAYVFAASDIFAGDYITADTALVYDSAASVVFLAQGEALVPEPTTATLSLLALAALAARRRRQK